MIYKFRGKSKNGDFYIYGMPTYDLRYIFNGSGEQYASPDNYEVMPETIVPYIGSEPNPWNLNLKLIYESNES